jgi:hypothetical protein
MIGRFFPCQVARVAAGTGRVPVLLITNPEMLGSAWVAFNMQALLSSARALAFARTTIEAAIAILMRIGAPTFTTEAHNDRLSPRTSMVRKSLQLVRKSQSIRFARCVFEQVRDFTGDRYDRARERFFATKMEMTLRKKILTVFVVSLTACPRGGKRAIAEQQCFVCPTRGLLGAIAAAQSVWVTSPHGRRDVLLPPRS